MLNYLYLQLSAVNKFCNAGFIIVLTAAPDLDGGDPGVVGGRMWGSDTESLGRGWQMKSLVFPRTMNIYDVML